MIDMKAIYIDWNIFQDIKQDRECYGLYEKLIDAKNKGFIIPYSRAHLQDLFRSNNEEYIKEDLEFISSITDNYYCSKYEEKNREIQIIYEKQPAINLYPLIKNIAKDTRRPNIPLYSFEPYKVDTKQISENNILLKYLKPVGDVMSPDLLFHMMNDFYPRIFEDHILQNKFKKSLNEVRALNNPAFKIISEMAFYKYFFEKENTISENLVEIVNSFLSISNKSIEKISLMETITTTYSILDYFPCLSEKISKKNNINNINTDGEHVFFGLFAKYFVTGDKNILKKAEILKKGFGLKVNLYSKENFIKNIEF